MEVRISTYELRGDPIRSTTHVDYKKMISTTHYITDIKDEIFYVWAH